MSRPSVATTLTSRPWEPAFASLVRSTGALRLVARAYRPDEIDGVEVDVVLAGAEVPWVDEVRIADWRRRGIRVVAVHAAHDLASRAVLERAGADVVLPGTTSPMVLLRHATYEGARPTPTARTARVVVVTGPRGAPGRTTVSLMLAGLLRHHASTALVDLDPPVIGLHFGLGPRMDAPPRHVDSVVVFAGVQPPRDPTRAVIRARATDGIEAVVVDAGPMPLHEDLLEIADTTLVVCTAEPVSLLRTATALSSWWAPRPTVVVNRAGEDLDLRPVRAALGLEPVVVPTVPLSPVPWPEAPASLRTLTHRLEDPVAS